MEFRICNRDILKKLPLIKSTLTYVTNAVYQVASRGQTNYFFEYPDTSPKPAIDAFIPQIQPQKYTKDEIQQALQLVFPGCTIEYTDGWVDTAPNVRMFKKGFSIDWS